MAFRKKKSQQEVELPTFIDIVFLLLIFFIVSFSPIPPKEGEAQLDLQLPTAQGAGEVDSSQPLETLLIEIIPQKSDEGELQGFQVSILLPFESYANQRGGITFQEAKSFAIQYNRQAFLPLNASSLNPREFSRVPGIQLINDQIDQYVLTKYRAPRPSNRIDIRADHQVHFSIINFIMEKCSSFDDLVPSLVFRTKYKRE